MTAEQLLQKHKLRTTDIRTTILNLFLNAEQALSEQNIECTLKQNCDRVTIYRSLKSFVEKGILHKVLDEGNVVKYALCGETCHDEDHQHEHVHFKCNTCGATVCFEEIPIQNINLPDGYKKVESNLLVLGICDKCPK